jgi:hypothetical protein
MVHTTENNGLFVGPTIFVSTNYICRYLNRWIYWGHWRIYAGSNWLWLTPYIHRWRHVTDEYRWGQGWWVRPPIFVGGSYNVSNRRGRTTPQNLSSRRLASLLPAHRRLAPTALHHFSPRTIALHRAIAAATCVAAARRSRRRRWSQGIFSFFYFR